MSTATDYRIADMMFDRLPINFKIMGGKDFSEKLAHFMGWIYLIDGHLRFKDARHPEADLLDPAAIEIPGMSNWNMLDYMRNMCSCGSFERIINKVEWKRILPDEPELGDPLCDRTDADDMAFAAWKIQIIALSHAAKSFLIAAGLADRYHESDRDGE